MYKLTIKGEFIKTKTTKNQGGSNEKIHDF